MRVQLFLALLPASTVFFAGMTMAQELDARLCQGSETSEVFVFDTSEPDSPRLLGKRGALVSKEGDTYSVVDGKLIFQISQKGILSILDGAMSQGTCSDITEILVEALELEGRVITDARELATANKVLRTQLADARAALLAAEQSAERALGEAEERAALLAATQRELVGEEAENANSARRIAVMNEQLAALRSQLGSLQTLLDASEARDSEARIQIEALGSRLNAALAKVAAKQRKLAQLEAERERPVEGAQ